MYNVWDLIGRYVPCFDFLKLESRKGLMIVILARFLLVPAFYFTAKYGDQGWMIMLTSFLGLSNGYLTVCVLTSAPKGYKVCAPHTLYLNLNITVDEDRSDIYYNLVFAGTGTKCFGKFTGSVLSVGYICRSNTRLVVAYRERLVIASDFKDCHFLLFKFARKYWISNLFRRDSLTNVQKKITEALGLLRKLQVKVQYLLLLELSTF